MTGFIDLFSGIGGFALAAYWAGLRFDKHYFSEIEPYCVELYQKRFPEAIPLGDIKEVDYGKLREENKNCNWLVGGGFPCQPHSSAGKRKGSQDERDLWSECVRMLRGLRPRVALFENVAGIFTTNGGQLFNRVLSDISKSGYDAEWQTIPAAAVGAPHLRKRVWLVAYTSGKRRKENEIQNRKLETQLSENRGKKSNENFNGTLRIQNEQFPKCYVLRDRNGLPQTMDSIGGAGNAIVPQCAEVIFNMPAFDLWRAV